MSGGPELTAAGVDAVLARAPRAGLCHLPTPLEFLPRLSEHLGGPPVYVKRDDCTGLASGGNKARKLEFLLGDALAKGADTVLTCGAVQSNHVRQTAAAAARLGLRCEVLFHHRLQSPDDDYQYSGNALLDDILGITVSHHPQDADMDAELELASDAARRRGAVPYPIPIGGSTPVGALGYVDCARELLQQLADADVDAGQLVLATGSGGTQAGLLAGLRACGSQLPVTGVAVSAGRTEQQQKVATLALATAEAIGAAGSLTASDVIVDDNYLGSGYGLPTDEMIHAVQTAARLEGLLFDPVYSGKALAGLFDQARNGHFDNSRAVVFLHTGGVVGLFAYRRHFQAQAGA